MSVLVQLEHCVRDYGAWKSVFDRDPLDRRGSGVRRYRILRPVSDHQYVIVELEFDEPGAARSFMASLERLWEGPTAQAAMAGAPRIRIVEPAEAVEL